MGIVSICLLCSSWAYSQACDTITPLWIIDLSSNQDSIWDQKAEVRDGYCCSASGTDKCIMFIVTLAPNVAGIYFGARNPGPSGSMYFVFECDTAQTYIVNQDTACVDGPGPHNITICKPGGDNPIYTIAGIGAGEISDPITASEACTDSLFAFGFNESSITWTSVPYDSTYNSYLSCDTACDTVIVAPTGNYPDSVMYKVCGTPAGLDCGGGSGNRCDSTMVYFVRTLDVQISPQSPVLCFGDPGVVLTAIDTGGNPPYSYLWSTGDTTQSITVGAGTYWVQVLDVTGCSPVYDTVTVTVNPSPISADAGPDKAVCINAPNVTLSGSVAIADGGVWTTPDGTGVFSPNDTDLNATYIVSAGDISDGIVTIILTTTGNGNCPAVSDTMIITISPSPTADAGSDITVCSDNSNVTLNGTVTVAIGGTWSTPNGTGAFSPGNTDLNATYIPSPADSAAGSVIIILISDSIGTCVGIDTMIITITPDMVTVDAGSDTVVCNNTPGIPLSGTVSIATGGTWSTLGSGTFIPSADSLNAIYVPSGADTVAGSVTLILTSTGNGGCSPDVDAITITLLPTAFTDAGPDTTVCLIDTIFLSGSVINAAGGVWTTSGTGTFVPNDSTLDAGYVPSAADNFNGTVTLILTAYGNNCPMTDTMEIKIIPTSNAGLNQVLCIFDDTVHLNGSVGGAAGGLWTTPDGTGVFIPNDSTLDADYLISSADSAAGTITFILASTGNLMGCPSAEDTMVVTIIPPPIVDAGPDTITICVNNVNIPLSGTVVNPAEGVWTTNGSGTFTPSADSLNTTYVLGSNDTAGVTVTLTLTTSGSCQTLSDSVLVFIIPPPFADFNYTEVCLNDIMSFTDNTPGSNVSWGWNFGDGNSDTIQNPQNLYASGGFYTVTLIVTSNTGCVDTTAKSVLIHQLPVAGFGSTAECFVDTAFFADSSTVANDSITSWFWDFGDGFTDTVQNPFHVYASEGSYIINLVVMSGFGCSDTITNILDVAAGPNAGFYFTNACFPDPVIFTDSSTIPIPHWIVSWNWDFGDGNTDTAQNPAPHYYSSLDTFNITLMVISENACTSSVSQIISVNLKPTAGFTFENACEMEAIDFLDSSGVPSPDNIIAWTWYFGDGNSDNVQNPSHDYSTYGFYMVALIVETNEGCRDTIQQMAVVSPDPTAQFTADNYTVSTKEDVGFTDQSIGSSAVPDTVPIVAWQWDFYYPASGSGDSAAITQNPYHNYIDTGRFTVQLIVTNEYGCTDTIYDEILVELNPVVPSGFSPDGNGENDILYVEGGPYSMLEFIIYNEWGEVIFVSNKQEDGWDGTFKGVKQQIGVYVYTVMAKTIDGKDHRFWGDVTLLR